MPLRDQIQSDVIQAMKAKDAETLSILRMVSAAIKNAEIDGKKTLHDEETIAVVARQVKQLEDARKDFALGKREDLLAKTDAELMILKKYLPAQLSDDALLAIVQETIAGMGIPDPSAMGKIMGAVMGKVKGQADGNQVKEAVGRVLGK